MNRRRQFFSTIGVGFLLAGGAAAVPREELAAAAKPHAFKLLEVTVAYWTIVVLRPRKTKRLPSGTR
jgi:hypothetical protein